jgi:hypothetical protein
VSSPLPRVDLLDQRRQHSINGSLNLRFGQSRIITVKR